MRRSIESVCLFALVSVVILRPLVAESYDSAGNPVTSAVREIHDPSPVRTLAFDMVILVAACTWVVSFATDKSCRYRRTGLEIGAAMIAIAGVVSCLHAGNKRLAINATVDWLCLPLLTIVMVQLLRKRSRRGLVIAAILASACAQAAQCYEQYFVGFAETRAEYEKRKVEFWTRQGVDVDSPSAESYERRLNSQEAFGFLPHSNVTGAYLALCGFVGAGVSFAGLRRRPRSELEWLVAGSALALTAAILGALVLTGSAGAMTAAGAGGLLWLGLRWFGGWIEAHRRHALWIGWACVLAAAIAVVSHGLYHKSLPSWSLTFRWQYWTASAEMIEDHPWTGVGRENFGRHYLHYKSIESPEEVSNPHNFLVQAAAEWGFVGLAGVIVTLVGASFAAARPRIRDAVEHRGAKPRAIAVAMAWMIGLLAVVCGLRSELLGTTDVNFLYYSAMSAGLCWLVGFVVFERVLAHPSGPSSTTARLANAQEEAAQAKVCGSLVSTAIGVGLIAFLLYETINFALFVPATATTFFALLAVWLSDRNSDDLPQTPFPIRIRFRWLAAVFTIVVTALVAWRIVFPVTRASRFLQDARASSELPVSSSFDNHPALIAFDSAAQADPLDPTPWIENASWLAHIGDETSLRRAIESLREGIKRDPYNASNRHAEARLFLGLARQTHQASDHMAAIEAQRAALSLYPRDPSGLVSLGDTQLFAGEALRSHELIKAAIESYQQALDLDNRRLSWETIRRLRPQQVAEVNARMKHARQLLADH